MDKDTLNLVRAADFYVDRIDALEKENEQLRKALSQRLQEKEELLEEVQRLQCALNFWMPSVPDMGEVPEEVIQRQFHDAYLLAGYDGEIVKTAEELGWVRLVQHPRADGT